MKIILTIVFSFFLLCSNAFAQTQLPPAYEIKDDTTYFQTIAPEHWIMLEDKSSKWKLDDVLAMADKGLFHSIKTSYDSTVNTYWIAYKLQNAMNREARISLNSMSNRDEFFVRKDTGHWEHFISGQFNKWEEKNGLKYADCIPVVMQPGEMYTVYQRIKNNKPGLVKDFHVAVVSTDQMLQGYYINYVDSRSNLYASFHLQEAFIIGLLFISILISLFFYRVVREKSYLYFALFAIFLAINRHSNIVGTYTLWFRPDWREYLRYIGHAWAFIPFFLVQFIRTFLGVKQKYPKWDRVVYFSGLLSLLFGIILLMFFMLKLNTEFNNSINVAFILSTFFLVPLCIIITSFHFIRIKKFRIVAMGSWPLMFLYLTTSLFKDSDLNGFLDIPSFLKPLFDNFRLVEMFSLAWLVLCFVRVLIMRFAELQKENTQLLIDKEKERNELIAAQKIQLEKDVASRTAELKQSLEELKSTQSQLIQSEKMASLGELTAGIAHEIQNPLNFVNNFSEVNKEMLEELKVERLKPNAERDESLQDELINDVIDNSEKINYHGKRADAIVKGMLQHSRTSSGKKELTDINALCDEYLRLSYHGLRAKDKSFNANFKTDFDESLHKINIISQDVGRVILNLINNAFYAVSERQKAEGGTYEPTVIVSTKKEGDKVLISVKDNGTGIPQNIADKIFQPFFTTKPTGSGTGLGLSLSYDIVKAHGGEMKVETKEGEETEFIIQLPISS